MKTEVNDNIGPFRQALIEGFAHYTNVSILPFKEAENGEIVFVGRGIGIFSNTCKLFYTCGGMGLGFPYKTLITECIGRQKFKDIQTAFDSFKETIAKIQDVLGEVPVKEELQKKVENLNQTIHNLTEVYDTTETIQQPASK